MNRRTFGLAGIAGLFGLGSVESLEAREHKPFSFFKWIVEKRKLFKKPILQESIASIVQYGDGKEVNKSDKITHCQITVGWLIEGEFDKDIVEKIRNELLKPVRVKGKNVLLPDNLDINRRKTSLCIRWVGRLYQ